jgi:hypothetical protein
MNTRTHKTQKLLDLLNSTGQRANPLLSYMTEENSPKIVSVTAIPPLKRQQESKPLAQQATQPSKKRYACRYDGKLYIANLSALAVMDKLADVMTRFRVCGCDICCDKMIKLALEELPAQYVRIADEKAAVKADETLEGLYTDAVRALAKAAVKVKAEGHKE